MKNDYFTTLFSDKLKEVAELVGQIDKVLLKLHNQNIEEAMDNQVTVIHNRLVELQVNGVDTASEETLAENLAEIIHQLSSAMQLISSLLNDKDQKVEGASTKTLLTEELIKQILNTKFEVGVGYQRAKTKNYTPMISYQTKRVSIIDLIEKYEFEWTCIREYVNNIFYGLRDGEFPYRFYDK